MRFQIGDKVQLRGDDLSQPFTVKNISKGPEGILYAGDGIPWTPEERLTHFLTEDEQALRVKYERTLHDAKEAIKALGAAGNELSELAMPGWFKTWFFQEMGKTLGWETF